MAEFHHYAKVTANTEFTVHEDEMRALHELSKYGGRTITEALKTFSPALVRDHGRNLETFFDSVHQRGGGTISIVDDARRLLADRDQKRADAKAL